MKILTTLLDIAVGFLRLLESEGRMFKRTVMNVVWALAFVGVASLLFLVASCFFLAGIYQYLAGLTSPAAASLLASFPALVLALVFAGIAKWWTGDQK